MRSACAATQTRAAMSDEAKVKEEKAGEQINIKVKDQARQKRCQRLCGWPRSGRGCATLASVCAAHAPRRVEERRTARRCTSRCGRAPSSRRCVAARALRWLSAREGPSCSRKLTRALPAPDLRRLLHQEEPGARPRALPVRRQPHPGLADACRGACRLSPRSLGRSALTRGTAQLEMEDGDSIDAMMEQVGGGLS